MVAPVFPGLLVRVHADLAAGIGEIEKVREHERVLIEQEVLARERAQLAPGIHDVVSHRVSLISVTAAALQVSTPDSATKMTASTIRELSATALDELRHMITVLRAAGRQPSEPHNPLSPTSTSSSPPVASQSSGMANCLPTLGTATVEIHFGHTAGELTITIENGPRPTHTATSDSAAPCGACQSSS